MYEQFLGRNPKQWSGQSASELYMAGYSQISRKRGHVARLDDNFDLWLSHQQIDSMECSQRHSTTQYYLRVVTKDVIEGVPGRIMTELRKYGAVA